MLVILVLFPYLYGFSFQAVGLFQDAEKTSSNSLLRCGEHVRVSPPASVAPPPIHMDNQTCLCSLNAQHPLCLIHCLFFHPPPPLAPPLTCSNTAGFFPDISFFFFLLILCLSVRWHTTHGGVYLLEENYLKKGTSRGSRGRSGQSGEVERRRREMRDCHQKK